MTECGICHSEVDFSGKVGHFEVQEWFIGKATAEKYWICEACLISVQAFLKKIGV